MATERKYEGWGEFDKNSIKGELKWFEYEPKQFVDDDVESKSSFSPWSARKHAHVRPRSLTV